MRKLKVCAAQFNISGIFSRNIKRAEFFIKNASNKNCDIICFPEIFLTGSLNIKSYNHNVILKSKKIFSDYCRNYGIFCIMGSIIEKINGRHYNISYLIDNKGEFIGDYKKNHLVQKSETKYLTSGNKTPVFKTKLGNIGMQICRDLLYPEVTRKLMLNGADIVFCPSFWCSKSPSYDYIYNNKYFKKVRPREVDFLCSSRAIESRVFFVYANAAGAFKTKMGVDVLLGRTQIASPFYGKIGILESNAEGILIKEIELDVAKDAKLVYKIEKDIKRYGY